MTLSTDIAVDVATMAGDLVSVTLDYKSTVFDLKLRIEDALLVPPEAQKLCLGDQILGDSVRLAHCGTFNPKTIHVEVTLVAAQKVTRASEVGAVRRQIGRLRSYESHVRDEAIRELTRLVGKDSRACYYMVEHALIELLKCLATSDAKTRRSVIFALSKVAPRDHEESVAALISCLADVSEWVRVTASDLLPNVVTPGNKFAIEKLERILRNRRVEVRAAGLLALSGMAPRGDDRIISMVSEFCDDKEDYIRLVASDVLQKVL